MAALCMVGALVLAPAALAQSTPASAGASASASASASAADQFDCMDFTYQEEAQAVYDQDTSDPNGLDGPIGEGFTGEEGVACEDLPSQGTGTDLAEEPAAETLAEPDMTEDQYSPAAVDQYDDGTTATPAAEPLPETGGASVPALGAGVLLVVGGLVARRIVR